MRMVNIALVFTLSVYIDRSRSIGLDTLPAEKLLGIAASLALEFHDFLSVVTC
jgi:hypothetical protein